jgi:peptidyl-prolyl cis-trans isomerase SurA
MKTFFVILTSLVLLSLVSNAQPSKKQRLLFSVGNSSVLSDEFVYLYDKNHKGKADEFTKAKVEEYLDLYIKFKLKVEEARSRGLDTTAKFKKEFAGYKDALRKPYLPDNKLIDSLATLTHQRLTEEVKASHILIRLQPDPSPTDTAAAYAKIIDLKKRLDAGEDFATLATQFSEDPTAKTNEGNLGYFSALQMVYPFESSAYNTPTGKVSAPTRTRFGYHLIKVTDRRAASGEIEVSHILVRSGKDRTTEKAKAQIVDVYSQLQSGKKWEDLCKQYSEDQSSKDSGGKLRPFGIGAMPSVPEFERTAFSLENEGQYSEPFATQYGWHLVRLEKKIPVPSYKEMESSLKSRVSRDERMQTAKLTIQKNLRNKYAFTENTDTKRLLDAYADTTLQVANWKKPNASVNDLTLFSLANAPVKTDLFFDYVIATQKQNKLTPSVYFNQLYNNFVDARIELAVEQDLMKTNADYRYLSNEYYEGILLFDVMEKEVWNRASEDSVGQLAYYEKNKANYTANERAESTIYTIAKQESVQTVKEIIADTVLTPAMAKKYNVRTERGTFEKSERPVFASIPWAKGLTEVELDGNYYLVKIEQILPAGIRSFEEARGLLISDYQTYLEKNWLDTLRKKYPVKVVPKGKNYVFSKLLK